jgi:flagellar assembly protein FliH
MRDLSSDSVPFCFGDLSKQDKVCPEAPQFVRLFSKSRPEPKREEADGDLSPEDQARKVFEDAYEQGEKAGFEIGMRKVEAIAKRLEKQVAAILSFERELETRYERLSTELALLFAESIVLRECDDDREILGKMIKKALEACEERSGLIIRVRPEDAKYVEGMASECLRIVKDESLKEPGFVIETNVGEIDGRISTQIEELRASLVGCHGE